MAFIDSHFEYGLLVAVKRDTTAQGVFAWLCLGFVLLPATRTHCGAAAPHIWGGTFEDLWMGIFHITCRVLVRKALSAFKAVDTAARWHRAGKRERESPLCLDETTVFCMLLLFKFTTAFQ
ncbi:hypothetical protein BV25DRAFT_1706637 [Artomyces pyxidatus]|uniref:Uncharacterized protein n=1 Tax=Artomyces pyxidatus TaxID=48021 RepID=A0ACB8TC14_9AGAM|nr:hypothetical protein BV25DRAFT_1706637 [Artomyces pyxidatus]